MSDENDKMVITLAIDKTTQRIKINRKQERSYRRAATLINERYNKYRESYQDQTEERYTAIVLLDMALQIVQAQEAEDTTPIFNTLKQLGQEIEQSLRAEQAALPDSPSAK